MEYNNYYHHNLAIDNLTNTGAGKSIYEHFNKDFNSDLSGDYFSLIDIFKPYPISYFDKLKNVSGVILDDVLAGLIVSLVFLILWTEKIEVRTMFKLVLE